MCFFLSLEKAAAVRAYLPRPPASPVSCVRGLSRTVFSSGTGIQGIRPRHNGRGKKGMHQQAREQNKKTKKNDVRFHGTARSGHEVRSHRFASFTLAPRCDARQKQVKNMAVAAYDEAGNSRKGYQRTNLDGVSWEMQVRFPTKTFGMMRDVVSCTLASRSASREALHGRPFYFRSVRSSELSFTL